LPGRIIHEHDHIYWTHKTSWLGICPCTWSICGFYGILYAQTCMCSFFFCNCWTNTYCWFYIL